MHKKFLFLFLLFSYLNLSFGATAAQVEQYLVVSHTEKVLLALEEIFSFFLNNLKNENTRTHDTRLLVLPFKEYLEKNLSDNAMAKILENYKNVVLQQFINNLSEVEKHDLKEINHYVKILKANPESAVRITLINKISTLFYSELFDDIITFFFMRQGIDKEKMNDPILKEIQKSYLKRANDEMLFATRNFTMQELESFLKIAKVSTVAQEFKVVVAAMVYALKDFFNSIEHRYDIKKHQTFTTK